MGWTAKYKCVNCGNEQERTSLRYPQGSRILRCPECSPYHSQRRWYWMREPRIDDFPANKARPHILVNGSAAESGERIAAGARRQAGG